MPSILTLPEYKALRGITDSKRDVAISAALPIAEDSAARYAQRSFNVEPTVDTRTFIYEGQPIVEIDDATSVTEVKLGGQPIGADAYLLGPQNSTGDPYYWIELFDPQWAVWDIFVDPFIRNTNPGRRYRPRLIEVTATYGWATIPPTVKDAVALLVDEAAQEVTQAGGVQAKAIVDYNVVYGDPGTRNEPATLPPRVTQLLDNFRRVLL